MNSPKRPQTLQTRRVARHQLFVLDELGDLVRGPNGLLISAPSAMMSANHFSFSILDPLPTPLELKDHYSPGRPKTIRMHNHHLPPLPLSCPFPFPFLSSDPLVPQLPLAPLAHLSPLHLHPRSTLPGRSQADIMADHLDVAPPVALARCLVPRQFRPEVVAVLQDALGGAEPGERRVGVRDVDAAADDVWVGAGAGDDVCWSGCGVCIISMLYHSEFDTLARFQAFLPPYSIVAKRVT